MHAAWGAQEETELRAAFPLPHTAPSLGWGLLLCGSKQKGLTQACVSLGSSVR